MDPPFSASSVSKTETYHAENIDGGRFLASPLSVRRP
jgi:hypothetical protein